MKYLRNILLFFLLVILSCSTTPKIEDGFIEIDEASIYYKTIGEGEPILFVHGGPGLDHKIFTPYIDELGSDFQVIYYDQRGTGLSTSPIDSASINVDKFVEDIELLRNHFNIEKLNLAGHSWGGMLSLFYAIKYPEKLKSLTLFCTSSSMDMLNQFLKTLRERRPSADKDILDSLEKTEAFENLDANTLDTYYRTYLKPYFKEPASSSKVTIGFTENAANNLWPVNRLIFKSLGNFNLDSSLSVIECPTLVMHGNYDLFPFEASERIHNNIPNSELVIFEDSGHWMFIEEQEKFLSEVKDHLFLLE